MCRLFSLVLCCWGISSVVYAQCPGRDAVYQQLTTISGYPDNQRIIRELTALRQQCNRCHQTRDSVYAKLLHVLGRTYWYTGNLLKGVALTNQAIAINNTESVVTNRANLTHSYYNLGRIYADQNKYQLALTAFDACIRIAEQYPHKLASGANAFEKKAYIYFLLGDYEKSVQQADKGADMARRSNDQQMIANTFIQKAQALIKLNQLPTAEHSLTTALTFAKESGNSNVTANVFSLLASVAIKQKNYKPVVHYYQQAFSLQRQIDFRYGCVQTLNNLGQFYEKQLKQYDKAALTLQQAYRFCDAAAERMEVLNSIGHVRYKQKQFQVALSYYQKAFGTVFLNFDQTRLEANPNAGQLRTTLNKLYLLTLIQDKADTWLDYASATGNNRQRLQYALDTYRVADQMIDLMRWEHTGQQSKLYWRQKTRSMYERAIDACYRLGDAEQAFRFFEKSRAVMLADKLAELGARQQLPASAAANEDALRKAVAEQQNELAGIAPDSSVYKAKQTALFAKQDELDAFLKQLEATNPAYYRYKYDTTTATLADLQNYLRPRKASFMTYFIGDSTLYLLSVTADRTTLKRQPLGRYNQTTQAFMGLLADPDAMNRKVNLDRFMTLGADLYRQLLAPLNLPDGPVVVSPDGASIPFGALSRSGLARSPDYLVKQYAFSYVYSARLLLRATADEARTASFVKHDFLGIAPVSFAPGLGQVSLPGSAEALNDIARSFRTPYLLTGRDATRRAFREQSANTRVVHLFTHANADSSSGSEPVLYFADSTLRLSDLGDGGLPGVQLAVLAACKTGIGANQRGEGVFSLGRGFAALGVPSVLTTLWSVENNATYEITTLFYANLTKGLPKDVALQRAQQRWLETAGTGNQPPNYWAGLIIVGDTQPLDQPTQWPWVAGGLLIVAAAGVGVWLRRRQLAQPLFSFPRPAPGV